MDDAKRAYRQDGPGRGRGGQRRPDRRRLSRAPGARWLEEIRLEDVAQDAGVTQQTVIRRFGGKDGLLAATVDQMEQEVLAVRRTAPGDPAAAVRVVIEDYEATGDLVVRVLAQEPRHPALKRVTDVGRAGHRQWIAECFAPWLDGLTPDDARRRTDALVVATDVYVWQLIRRDMRRPVAEVIALMERLIAAVLATPPEAADGRE